MIQGDGPLMVFGDAHEKPCYFLRLAENSRVWVSSFLGQGLRTEENHLSRSEILLIQENECSFFILKFPLAQTSHRP